MEVELEMCTEEYGAMYKSLQGIRVALWTNAIARHPKMVRQLTEQVAQLRTRNSEGTTTVVEQHQAIMGLRAELSKQQGYASENLFSLKKSLFIPREAQLKTHTFYSHLHEGGLDALVRIASFIKKYTE